MFLPRVEVRIICPYMFCDKNKNIILSCISLHKYITVKKITQIYQGTDLQFKIISHEIDHAIQEKCT